MPPVLRGAVLLKKHTVRDEAQFRRRSNSFIEEIDGEVISDERATSVMVIQGCTENLVRK